MRDEWENKFSFGWDRIFAGIKLNSTVRNTNSGAAELSEIRYNYEVGNAAVFMKTLTINSIYAIGIPGANALAGSSQP